MGRNTSSERHHKRYRRALHGWIGMLIAVFLFAPLSPTLHVQRAHAQLPVIDVTQALKELSLDGLARTLAQNALSQMSASIVRWINSGFDGSPAFVTDLEGFLRGVADQAAADFLDGNALAQLCQPLRLPIQQILTIQYFEPFEERISCSLSDALLGRVNAGGSRVSGLGGAMRGWDDWFNVTTEFSNNQYAALHSARQELDQRTQNAVQNQRQELDWGDGFRTFKVCVGSGAARQCFGATPGRVIADQLNDALGWGADSLINADEIGDIVNALFSQLVQETLTSSGGLIGLSQGSSGSSPFLDRLELSEGSGIGNSVDTSNLGNLGDLFGTGTAEAAEMQDSLDTEGDVLSSYGQAVTRIDAVEDIIPTDCDFTLSESLVDQRQSAEDGILETTVNIAALEDIADRYDAADTDAERDEIYDEYLELVGEDSLHSDTDIDDLEQLLSDLEDEIDDFELEIAGECLLV